MKKMIIFSVILFTGCGDDSAEADGCSLEGTLTGEVNKTIAWNDTNGCGAAVSSSLLTFTFGTFQSDSIIIGTFGEAGVLASAVDGYVMYRDADGAEWNTRDCLIDITRNEENSHGDYIVGGQANCSTPAVEFGGGATGEINFSPLDSTIQVPF